MKTNLIKKLASLALSAFAIGSFAQCPTLNGIYVQQGTGTATVAAVMTPSTSAGTGYFNWTVNPSATSAPVPGTNNSIQGISFTATGVYSVCVYYTDSTTMCSASTCTTITVTSTVSTSCNAAFSALTNTSTCITQFSNSSTGSSLSYKWYKLPGMTLLSTAANPALNLGNGSHLIGLYTYSYGQFCDSTMHTVNVNCGSAGPCNAAFTVNTDSNTCITHFSNASTGTNLSYRWYRIPGMTLLSTAINPALSLGNGSHTIALYTYSNNQFCDSTLSVVNVNCSSSGNCNASFTHSVSPNCNAYFYSTTTGSNLTYEWRNMSAGFSLLSTQNSFTTNLPGSNLIGLYVYSNGQFCDSVTQMIYCGMGSCSASFNAYTDSTCTTHFVNTGMITGSAPSWIWNVNGNTYTSTHLNLNLPNGSHHVTLYNYSNNQLCDSTSQWITVACGGTTTPCQAHSQFTVFADSANAGNYFAYNQSTAGAGVVSYLWNFGDGTTSTQAFPFHQYATPGRYVICLTVSVTNGSVTCSDISCDSSSVRRMASGYLMSRLQVLPQGATAVKESTILKNLSVYPNPVDNELTVETELTREEKVSYVITDALGKVVAKDELSSSRTIINTTTLDRGIYFLSLTSGDQVLKTTKIVK